MTNKESLMKRITYSYHIQTGFNDGFQRNKTDKKIILIVLLNESDKDWDSTDVITIRKDPRVPSGNTDAAKP